MMQYRLDCGIGAMRGLGLQLGIGSGPAQGFGRALVHIVVLQQRV